MRENSGRKWGWVNLASLLFGLLAWEAASRMNILPQSLFPPPTRILGVLYSETRSGRIFPQLAQTLEFFFVGGSLGGLAGLAAALLCGRRRIAAALIDPWVDATFPLPHVAVIPLLMMLVGAGNGLCVAMVALEMFYHVFIAVRGGLSQVNESLLEAARNLGASDSQIMREVTLPSLLPFLFIGARLGLIRALGMVVLVEALFSLRGVGHALWMSGEWLRMGTYYAYVFVLGVLGIAIAGLLKKALRVFTPWARSADYDRA